MNFSARIWPALVTALSLALGLLWSGVPRLWNDEASSFFASVDGLRRVFEWTAQDTHPPLYYIVLAFWMRLGESEAVIRALSAVTIAGTTWFTWLTARRWFSPGAALLAALLFTLDPTTISWAQKARPYGLQALLVAISLWGFVAGFLAPRARQAWLGTGFTKAWRRRDWGEAARSDLACLAYIVGGGLAMLAQHTAGFFVFGCNAAMLVRLLQLAFGGEAAAARRLFCNWVIAQILLIGIWALWLPFFLVQYHQHLTASGLAQHSVYLIDRAQLWDGLSGLFGSASAWRLRPVIFAIFMTCAIPSCLMLAREQSDRRLMAIILLAPLALCLAGFALVHPVFGYVIKTFLWVLIPYCIVIAAGIVALPWPIPRLGVICLLVAVNAYSLRNYYQIGSPPLDAAANFIAATQRADDGFMVSKGDATREGIGYYLRRANAAGVLDVSVYGPRLVRDMQTALIHPRVWLILPVGEEAPVPPDQLGARMDVAADRQFGDVRVVLYNRRSP